MSFLSRLGAYISTRAHFVKASVLAFGLPFGVFLAFVVGEYGPVAVVLALLLAPVAGYVWGVAMWELFFKAYYARWHR